jgi:hypothetical protein
MCDFDYYLVNFVSAYYGVEFCPPMPNIENASIKNASIENASIENANIENASIENASIENASIENTNIENINIENTNIENINIENIINYKEININDVIDYKSVFEIEVIKKEKKRKTIKKEKKRKTTKKECYEKKNCEHDRKKKFEKIYTKKPFYFIEGDDYYNLCNYIFNFCLIIDIQIPCKFNLDKFSKMLVDEYKKNKKMDKKRVKVNILFNLINMNSNIRYSNGSWISPFPHVLKFLLEKINAQI